MSSPNPLLPPSHPGAQQVACGVCGHILDYDGLLRLHVHPSRPPGQSLNDHPVVPVLVRELPGGAVVVCDFCGSHVAGDKVWTVPASDFPMPPLGPGDRPRMSVADWAACPVCVALVQRNDWQALIQRVLTIHNMESDLGRRWVTRSYQRLREHITGEPYPGSPKGR